MRRIRVGFPSRSYQSSRPRFSICDGSTARTPQNCSVNGEVDGGLLVRRVEVEEDDVLRREAREDRLADDALVARGVEAGEVPAERARRPGTRARELLALRDLEGVERREGLELDQLRREPAAGVARDREVRRRRRSGTRRSRARRSRGGTAASERSSASGVESWRKISSDAETISSRSSGGRKTGVSARRKSIGDRPIRPGAPCRPRRLSRSRTR